MFFVAALMLFAAASAGKMYVTDSSALNIVRANLDGSGNETIASGGVSIVGVAVLN
ncbi:MAG: hypothetical protein ABSG63_01620 [Spirochaetia bacterium]|jgi:hypothetical protein